jgi:AbrB family looped-hinge helix DNA binding protein
LEAREVELEAQKVELETRKVFGKTWKVTFMALKVDPETFPKTFMTFWTVVEDFPAFSEVESSPTEDAGPTAGRVVIPAEVRKQLGLATGTELEMVIEGFAIRLVRPKPSKEGLEEA